MAHSCQNDVVLIVVDTVTQTNCTLSQLHPHQPGNHLKAYYLHTRSYIDQSPLYVKIT